MNKSLIVIAVFVIILAACDRPPRKNDIPVRNASDNSIDHSGMRHSTMESSSDASSAPYELQFIDTMIAHHQGAIDMAQLVQTRAEHAELKSMAANVISEQQKEISVMREWRNKFFKDAPPAVNMDLAEMRSGMSGMDLDKLDSLKENAFDVEFLNEMVPHHEGAVAMAKDLLSRPVGENEELDHAIRSLAQSIIDSQSAEIGKMKEWRMTWSKQS